MESTRLCAANALLGRGVIPKREIPVLTPDLAVAYSACGPKTLTRDLNELVTLSLIEERDGGFAARVDVLLNLLPLVVDETGSGDGLGR